jgi:hypothetical protein
VHTSASRSHLSSLFSSLLSHPVISSDHPTLGPAGEPGGPGLPEFSTSNSPREFSPLVFSFSWFSAFPGFQLYKDADFSQYRPPAAFP